LYPSAYPKSDPDFYKNKNDENPVVFSGWDEIVQ